MTAASVGEPFITRRRLLTRLDARSGLTLLRAPAGFGKTALVRQWADGQSATDELLATVRVRPGEGDAASFWITVVEALTDAGLAEPALLQARSPQSSAARMVSTVGRPLVLWIDNFENVTAAAADEVLLDLVRHVEGFRLVVATRSHRHFSPRLLDGLDTTVLEATDLLLTAEETAILAAAAGLQLSDAGLQAVRDAAAGWPELTRTLLVAQREAPTDIANDPASLDLILSDWLRDRLLPALNRPDVAEFATAIAVPDEISPALAEHLAGSADAKTWLEAFVAAGALLPAPEHPSEPRFRWPPNARRVLLEELRRERPDRLAQLHEQVARWYAEHDRPADALRHAVHAAAWPRVVEIIDRFWRRLLLSHRPELNEALLATPAHVITGKAPLGPARAVRTMFLRTEDEAVNADVLPSSVEDLTALGTGAEVVGTLNTGLAVLAALRTPRGLMEATTLAGRLVTVADAARANHPGEVADLYPSVHFYAGETHLSAGDFAAAVPHLEEAYRRSVDSSLDYLMADAAGKLAAAHALDGDAPNATIWLERHEAAPAPSTWLRPYIRSTAAVARLLTAIDRLDLDAATDAAHGLLGNALPDVRWAQELYARALLAVHTGTAASVLEQIDHARRRKDTVPSTLQPFVASVEADLLLALGQGNQARAVLDGRHTEHPLLRVGRARLAMLVGDPTTALAIASDAAWQRHAWNRHRQEMLLIRAVAALRVGDAPMATEALRHALAAARATGAVRPFTTVARADLEQLAPLVPGTLDLLDERPPAGVPEVYGRSLDLIELTPRERDVLVRIAQGLSIRQIAIELHIAYSTVRTQQRSLYRKLGVATQTDAVGRARQAGLLVSS